jgi:hypothetical protein
VVMAADSWVREEWGNGVELVDVEAGQLHG